MYDGINIRRLKFPALKIYKNEFSFEKNKFEENLYDVISWGKLKKFLLNFYFNIFKFNKNLIKLNQFKLKPIIGDLVDIELLTHLRKIIFTSSQSIIYNGTDNLLLSSFYDSCLNYDIRSDYILDNLNFNNYNLLLLINANLRLENPLINAKLRQEYIWNNLLIYNFGSKYNLTYKYYQLDNNINSFIKFIKGQHLLNNLFVNKKYKSLILITSSLIHNFDNIYYKNFFLTLKRIFLN